MSVKLEYKNDILTAFLSGEIDHHNAVELRTNIDKTLQSIRPPVLKLDFKDVPFMDSSGVGLILGRIRLVKHWNGRVILTNITEDISKMAKLAGVFAFTGGERR